MPICNQGGKPSEVVSFEGAEPEAARSDPRVRLVDRESPADFRHDIQPVAPPPLGLASSPTLGAAPPLSVSANVSGLDKRDGNLPRRRTRPTSAASVKRCCRLLGSGRLACVAHLGAFEHPATRRASHKGVPPRGRSLPRCYFSCLRHFLGLALSCWRWLA